MDCRTLKAKFIRHDHFHTVQPIPRISQQMFLSRKSWLSVIFVNVNCQHNWFPPSKSNTFTDAHVWSLEEPTYSNKACVHWNHSSDHILVRYAGQIDYSASLSGENTSFQQRHWNNLTSYELVRYILSFKNWFVAVMILELLTLFLWNLVRHLILGYLSILRDIPHSAFYFFLDSMITYWTKCVLRLGGG